MKNLLLFILLSYFPFTLLAQVSFEKGYIINNNDERIECFIYNEDWRNNPSEIEYRMTEDDIIKSETIDNIKEFGIDNESKYIRYKGKIDISSNITSKLSDKKEPIWEEQVIFLKVIIEGKAKLFYYFGNQLERFYYQIDDGEIEPLIYKQYTVKIDGSTKSTFNTKFKRQLLINMKCETMTMQDVEKLSYNKKALSNYFIKYHECLGEKAIIFQSKKYEFHVGLKAGYSSQSFSYRNTLFFYEFETSGFAPRFGLETEITLPFNNNKWSIIFSPMYQFMNSQDSALNVDPLTNALVTREFELKYQSIELQLGGRYYIFLNQHSKIFTNISYVRDFTINSTLSASGPWQSIVDFDSGANFALGIGYELRNISLELRYLTPRDSISPFEHDAAYSNFSLLLRYDLF